MTYDIPYEPPQPQFADTLLAFQAITGGPYVRARIAPDPLGPVNKIVSLMVGERVVKSVLWHVPAGARVGVVHETGAWTIDAIFALKDRRWNTCDVDLQLPDLREPGWYIEIDGRVVLYATEAEVNPPSTWTPPRVPLWRRMRQALAGQVRDDLDAVAGRLGYHRDCAQCGWDE